MRDGLEYAISILKRRAARHKKMLSGDFSKSDKYMQLRHHAEMEACLSAAKLLRRKLRSVIKESQPQPNNKASGKCPTPDGRIKCSACGGKGWKPLIGTCMCCDGVGHIPRS